ncbi:MAG: guanine deaminase [Oligoflexia bacterium]|nr:guanine deaminase [Oligoflexia bacterium]MBF0364112.1 guanine deaminase [Oligoflexia bacterium]
MKAYRATIIDFAKNPQNDHSTPRYFEDGVLIVNRKGLIHKLGAYKDKELQRELRSQKIPLTTYKNKIIMPGLIDVHLHFPQTEIIASYGEQLLTWLERYTFPTEGKFKNRKYGDVMAKIFFKELLRNGTTTAAIYGTVHPDSVEAMFSEAARLNMRVLGGKVLMDRHAPDFLTDTPKRAYEESKRLIKKWHGHKRLSYAVTPRFAPTSTPEQLEMTAKLMQENPDVYLQTHLSENLSEIEWVKALFPSHKNYFDVYKAYGLVGRKCLFGHAIHLSEGEWQAMRASDSVIAFCPTSNLFLGSGLFKLRTAQAHQLRVGVATDVGGGTSFSMIKTLSDAYKVIQLQGENLSALEGFYLATLGGARALGLDNYIGNFDEGQEADFIVVDPKATPIQKLRDDHADSNIAERLFALMILGDDRSIYETYIQGKRAHSRD